MNAAVAPFRSPFFGFAARLHGLRVLFALGAHAAPVSDDLDRRPQARVHHPSRRTWDEDSLPANAPCQRNLRGRRGGHLAHCHLPSHTTLITGVWPAEHGIYNNHEFDPFQRYFEAWNWYASQIRVPTLWQAAHKAGLRTASIGWPVSVGATRRGLPHPRILARPRSIKPIQLRRSAVDGRSRAARHADPGA